MRKRKIQMKKKKKKKMRKKKKKMRKKKKKIKKKKTEKRKKKKRKKEKRRNKLDINPPRARKKYTFGRSASAERFCDKLERIANASRMGSAPKSGSRAPNRSDQIPGEERLLLRRW